MRVVKIIALFFVIFLLTLGLLMTFNQSAGKQATDFTITTFDGENITLSELKDKPVVVNIWASWCGPCREEAAELEKFWGNYKSKVHMVGINYSDDKKNALEFIEEFKITYPNGPDVDSKIFKDYKATGVPETFVIKDMKIVEHIVGVTDSNELGNVIDNLDE